MVWLWILCIWLALGPVGNVAQQHQQQQEEQVVEQVVEVEEELPSCADFQEYVTSSRPGNTTLLTLAASRWDSGEERSVDGVPTTDALPRVELSLGPGAIVGVRFPALPLAATSVVGEAHVVFEVRRQQSWAWEGAPVSAGAVRVQVFGELSVNAAPMGTASTHDIGARTLTASSVTWDVPPASAHDTVSTPDLSSVVAEIVAQAGWVEGAPIVLIFRHIEGRGTRWLQAESLWNGLRTPALVVSEGHSGTAAQPCGLLSSDCPFSPDSADGTAPCLHPACVQAGLHRARTCCYAMSAYCDGSAGAECASVVAACAQFVGSASDAAAKLRTACATEYAECAGSVCSEQELMPLLAALDNGSESVTVAHPTSYSTPEMTKLMICALQSGDYQGYGYLQPASACAVYPCRNGGACSVDSSTASGFTCQCLAGYEGDTCEELVDECASNPCLNGGSCFESEEVDAFLCACALNYRGEVCQHLTGSLSASLDAERTVTAEELRSAISTMLSQPEEHITLTNLEYYIEVDVTVQLAIGHTLTRFHPNADAMLEQAVRDSLSFASIGFQILSGGSDALWADIDEYAVDEETSGHGRRLRSSSSTGYNEAAGASATDNSTNSRVVQMPADMYARKIARQLRAVDANDRSRPSDFAGTAASEWLDKSINKLKGVEARNHHVDQDWGGAGINTPAFAKRGRSKAKRQRAAMEAVKQIETQAAETLRRQLEQADADAAATKAASTAAWSYRLTSDADLPPAIIDPDYPALLAAKFNDASAWCREAVVNPCRRDQVDSLGPTDVVVDLVRITTAVEYEVLLTGNTTSANTSDTASSTQPANTQLMQQLWAIGVPILGEATVQALPEGTCTHGAVVPNSNRAHVNNRCRGAIGATCPYICDTGYRPSSTALHCAAGGTWLGGDCQLEDSVVCPASGQWWDLKGALDTRTSELAVPTDEASPTASVSTGLLVAQEPWSSCHTDTDTSVNINVVCATDADGQYEPCGGQMHIGTHRIMLIASKISGASEIRATASFVLSVVDKEPPRLDWDACPVSTVSTWMTGVHVSVTAVDNSGEVRLSACTTDMITEKLVEPAVISGRRSRIGFIVEPSVVADTLPMTRCITSSVSGALHSQLDIAPAGPGQWLVITAEDQSGNVDRCDSQNGEW